MKMNSKLNFLLAFACLIVVSLGCRNANFPPTSKNDVVKLDKLGESPKSKGGDIKIGDQVVLIDNDGNLSFNQTIDGTSGKLVLVAGFTDGTGKEWKPAEQSYSNSYDEEKIERTAPAGYRFKYNGSGRYPFYKYFPAEQVFPAPWANNVNLKIGDTVYKNISVSAFTEKGVISEVPLKRFGNYRVRFGNKETSTEVAPSVLYTSVEPATAESLSPGDLVYYDKQTWAMVIGRLDDKIIIRQSSTSKPEDILVDVSKLQIVR